MTQEDFKKRRKSRKESEDNSEEFLPKQEKVVSKMPFSVWFNKMLKRGKVKYWQEEPLLVYMRKQGLSQAEAEDQYSEVLKKF